MKNMQRLLISYTKILCPKVYLNSFSDIKIQYRKVVCRHAQTIQD